MRKGELRFALDTVGKETTMRLRESLRNSKGGRQTHLVALTGLSKTKFEGVKYHSIPIKVLHTVPIIGEKAMSWLEQLLLKNVLNPSEIAVADGGLAGIHGALDRLRNGTISGERSAIHVGSRNTKEINGVGDADGPSETETPVRNLDYADNLNKDPSRIKFT